MSTKEFGKFSYNKIKDENTSVVKDYYTGLPIITQEQNKDDAVKTEQKDFQKDFMPKYLPVIDKQTSLIDLVCAGQPYDEAFYICRDQLNLYMGELASVKKQLKEKDRRIICLKRKIEELHRESEKPVLNLSYHRIGDTVYANIKPLPFIKKDLNLEMNTLLLENDRTVIYPDLGTDDEN